MRLLNTILLAVPCVSALERSAQVYLLPPNPAEHHRSPALNPVEGNALISHHLGLDIYENIGDRIEGWWNDLIALVHGPSSKMGTGVGEGVKDSVLIVVHSNHPEDFLPPTMKQSFSIPNPPDASMFTDLIQAYTERAHQLFNSVFSPILSSIPSSPAYKSLLDIFELVGEAGKMFVEEFGRLVEFVEADIEGGVKKTAVETQFVAVEIKSLGRMPRDSEEYVTAVKSVQSVLSHPSLQNKKAAIIVVPPANPSLRRRDFSNPQAPEFVQQQPLSSSSNKIVFSVDTCFASNDTCFSTTDNCSGHGTCNAVTKAGRTCYTCSCAITKNDQGRRQWWAGQSCEKLDMSTPFTLLAGTGIALVIIVLASVYLLMSVGDEALPNTLTATAMPRSSKRD